MLSLAATSIETRKSREWIDVGFEVACSNRKFLVSHIAQDIQLIGFVTAKYIQ